MKAASPLVVLLSISTTLLFAIGASAQDESNSDTLAITGVPQQNVAPRLEIRDLQRDHPEQFNLYILALSSLMNTNETERQSYFAISGIHGLPYAPWDGQTSKGGPTGYNAGYCTHASNVFLPFHRPYVALWEQTLYSHAAFIAYAFPEDRKQKYVGVLPNFRAPYWDWAAPPPCAGCSTYPEVLTQPTINLDTPGSGRQDQPNPLYRYEFKRPASSIFGGGGGVNDNQHTVRDPTSPVGASSTSQDGGVSGDVTRRQRGWADRVYNLMTIQHDFVEVGDSSWTSGASSADSFEAIHNDIHTTVGQGGHMTYPALAAYDPVFWLHHVNVDRLWAMWAALNPDSYVQSANNKYATFTTPENTVKDADTPLSPFNKDNHGTPYTANDVRDTKVFKYTYPELVNPTPDSVTAAVNKLYGNSSGGRPQQRLRRRDSTSAEPGYHYMANIVSQKSQLNGSYTVHVFLGEPPADPKDYSASPQLVGTQGVFANTLYGEHGEHVASKDVPVAGTVPLTRALSQVRDKGDLSCRADLHPDPVGAYLRKNLHWRVTRCGGLLVDNKDVPGLSVSVVHAKVTAAAHDAQFPSWDGLVALPDVTLGRPGGHLDRWWGPGHRRQSSWVGRGLSWWAS